MGKNGHWGPSRFAGIGLVVPQPERELLPVDNLRILHHVVVVTNVHVPSLRGRLAFVFRVPANKARVPENFG